MKTTALMLLSLFVTMATITEAQAQSRSDRDRLRSEARARNRANTTVRTGRSRRTGSTVTTTTRRNPRTGHTTTTTTRHNPRHTTVRHNRHHNRHGGGVIVGNTRRPDIVTDRYNRHDRYDRYGRSYGTYRHTRYTPYRHNYVARRNYLRTRNYYDHVYRYNRNYIWNNWIRVPSYRTRGYHVVDGYPYYVFNGYRMRYSNTDYCNYQLVDTRYNSVRETYSNYTCSRGLDECMDDANYENSWEHGTPYMCLEAHSRW